MLQIRLWVGDITYLRVNNVFKYLAVVMDKYSRRIVGWSLGESRDVNVTLRALNNAILLRQPKPGLIFHSDRGIEYSAHAFARRLNQLGIIQSMNRPKTMNDNANMESFFHNFKLEFYHGKIFTCINDLRRMIESYIPFYNYQRIHSGIGYLSPVNFEKM